MLGALADNVAIVFYSYAMAIDALLTDPILAAYPVLVMIGGRLFMKEKLGFRQYLCLIGVIGDSILIVLGTM